MRANFGGRDTVGVWRGPTTWRHLTLVIRAPSTTTKESRNRWSWIRYRFSTLRSIVPSASSLVDNSIPLFSHHFFERVTESRCVTVGGHRLIVLWGGREAGGGAGRGLDCIVGKGSDTWFLLDTVFLMLPLSIATSHTQTCVSTHTQNYTHSTQNHTWSTVFFCCL